MGVKKKLHVEKVFVWIKAVTESFVWTICLYC